LEILLKLTVFGWSDQEKGENWKFCSIRNERCTSQQSDIKKKKEFVNASVLIM
jgi:hypothetical protein